LQVLPKENISIQFLNPDKFHLASNDNRTCYPKATRTTREASTTQIPGTGFGSTCENLASA